MYPEDSSVEGGVLSVGGCDARELAREFGTPAYVVAEADLRARARAFVAALDAVRPGPEGREVDAVARDIIEAAGHGEHFGHGLGHGVGLEVHEAPRLARTGEAVLAAGNVVTVEPGVYLPGRGGVRIEDLVVVTEEGRRVISGTTKQLITVD